MTSGTDRGRATRRADDPETAEGVTGRSTGRSAPDKVGRRPPFLGRPLGPLATLRDAIARVPRGRVITYGGVAILAGRPGATRLVVRALQGGDGLPWHRVVGAGGRIALSGEDGQEQRRRLEMEGVTFRGGRVRLDLHLWTPKVRGLPRTRGKAGAGRPSGRMGRGKGSPT